MIHSNNVDEEMKFGYMPGGTEDETTDDDSTDNGNGDS